MKIYYHTDELYSHYLHLLMEIEESIRLRVESILDDSRENMGHALGIRFLKLSRAEVVAEMPVDSRTVQPMRILHGGASVALAESLMSIGALLNLEDPELRPVGLEINANHVRQAKEGDTVNGHATPIHLGRSTQIWQTRILNREGNLVSISRCTLAVIKPS